jgi:GT2 family glycosyltransferase
MNNESLTIVYSTRTDNRAFQDHIQETCGIEDVEILQSVNDGGYALTEIYNRGLRESRNKVVVFTHDDVIFEHGSNWGRTILKHFRESEFGILGKAGTTSITGSGKWWDELHLLVGIVWHEGIHPDTGKIDTWENRYSGDFGDKIIETIMVDGVFFAAHKERIRERFDENIKGFHFYDVDFGLVNHLEAVKVGVIFDIKIVHKSIGETNKQWEQNRIVFLNKWRSRLPYHIKPEVMYDDPATILNEEPSVAIIIHSQNGPDSLVRCIENIRGKTRYTNYKFYVSFMSHDSEMIQRLDDNKKEKDIILVKSSSVSPAAIKNNIVKNHLLSDTDILLFCHDDVELLNDAISQCVRIYAENKQEIGTLGIRLHLGNNTIQHAGIQLTIGKDERLRISHRGYGSYYNYTVGTERDIFSNSGAFMMVDRECFLSLGGFSEWCMQWLEDIDLNFRLVLAGRVNYFSGEAAGYHYELETATDHAESVRKKSEDLGNLLGYIHGNLNNPRVMKHLKFIYA